MNCPECNTKDYRVLPSRKNCQTCLQLRIEHIDAWTGTADAARNRRELEHRSAGKALGLVRI